jgi:hypothetical protein
VSIYDFKPNDPNDGHIDGILHGSVPIFGTKVHLAMPNNIAKMSPFFA